MAGKIEVILVDDDEMGRRSLRDLIAQFPSLSLVGEAADAMAGAQIIQKERPDAVFLDIHMPNATGFDLLQYLDFQPKVVFVTSSPHHAIQAMEIEAVDYLLKPLVLRRFAATVRRLERLFLNAVTPVERHEKADRLYLRTDSATMVVSISSMVALQANGDFTHVLCADTHPILVSRSLGEYEELLPTPPFLRLDRSLIVNLDRMTRADRLSRNLSFLYLRGLEKPLELGRTATERLRQALNESGRISDSL